MKEAFLKMVWWRILGAVLSPMAAMGVVVVAGARGDLAVIKGIAWLVLLALVDACFSAYHFNKLGDERSSRAAWALVGVAFGLVVGGAVGLAAGLLWGGFGFVVGMLALGGLFYAFSNSKGIVEELRFRRVRSKTSG